MEVARSNGRRHGLDSRITFAQGDLFDAGKSAEPFHLIISNPPYIPTAEILTLQQEVRDFDPAAALDGGADGLECHQRIALEGQRFLTAEGKCMVEFGDGQANAVRDIFEKQNWVVEAVIEDYTRKPRIMIAGAGKL